MSREAFLTLAGGYFVLVFALILTAIRRGRRLWRDVQQNYPDVYETLGRPRPGLWDAPRRTRHFAVINSRAYAQLDDEALVQRFERLRGFEYRMFFTLIAGLIYLAAVGYLNKDTWGV